MCLNRAELANAVFNKLITCYLINTYEMVNHFTINNN